MVAHWLVKSEPHYRSWQNQLGVDKERWDSMRFCPVDLSAVHSATTRATPAAFKATPSLPAMLIIADAYPTISGMAKR